MDKRSIVLLLDPVGLAGEDHAPATASTLRYRHLLDEVLGGSTELLPFPVLRPAIHGNLELLLRLIEDLQTRYGTVVIVVPESGSKRRPPINLPANVDWLSFADKPKDVLALLRRDVAPTRGSFPLGPLSIPADPPTKGGGFGVPSAPSSSGMPRAPSSSQATGGDKVFTGVSVPPNARPGRTFVASFAAYTDDHRDHVFRSLNREAPKHDARLDLDKCLWLPGARVRVDLRADGCLVSPPNQTFTWDGTWEILRFDVELDANDADEFLTLRFDISVEGVTIRHLRPQIEVRRNQPAQAAASRFTEVRVPGSAFASYSTKDKHDVKSRVRSLQIHTKMDIFLDRTHLVPGDLWQAKLEDEVRKREQFWLFWSRNAKDSIWVDREWKLALREGKFIEPHPLDVTPPPPELAYLQFGTDFEAGLSSDD